MSIPVLSADAVRAAERAFPDLLANGTLMERAATAVATECMAVLREHGGVVGRHVLLLVGAGDNGGDALFAGARLAKRGVSVAAVAVAERMHDRGVLALREAGGRIVDVNGALALFDRVDVVIDGIVGLGSSRGLEGDAALLAKAIDDAQLFTVAIDVPSGVSTDTGAVSGVAVRADVTITFGASSRHCACSVALWRRAHRRHRRADGFRRRSSYRRRYMVYTASERCGQVLARSCRRCNGLSDVPRCGNVVDCSRDAQWLRHGASLRPCE